MLKFFVCPTHHIHASTATPSQMTPVAEPIITDVRSLAVGRGVGTEVGIEVGTGVGVKVGSGVGVKVGSGVGSGVGCAVGNGVG